MQQVQVRLPGNWVAISQAELDRRFTPEDVRIRCVAARTEGYEHAAAANSILQKQVDELIRQRDDLRAALNHAAVATVEDRNFRKKWFNEGYTTALKDRRAAMTANDAELDAQLFASNKR